MKDLGQKPQTKCRPKSACEKRIESRGFKTWKQQLRDIIDINKQCATDWQSFVELMNRDGIEVRETHNKRTGEIGYTYHFKEPVFNKKTGKEFHFACKDKNLSDNADNPLKYTRSEIYYFFDFKTPAKFEDERFLRVEKHKIHVEMMKYFGYMPLIMPPSHKKVVGVLKPKHNLPENLKVVEPKTYHGKLTRATIRQTQANIQAMAEAIRIVKEQNIRSEADLKKRLEETTTKKQELELKRHKFDEICDQYDALANNLKMYEDTGKREYKNWLKKHGVDYKNIDSDYYKRMSKTVKQQRDNIKNEIALLDNFEGECQKAYNIIRDNLEVRTYLPCTSRCEGILPNQKIPYVIKNPNTPTAEQRLIQEQQQISENETMRYARQIQYWQYINSPRKSQLEEVQLADNTQKLQQESSNIDTGIENKPVRNECAHSASTSPVQQVVEKERPRHLPPTENIAVATQRAADYNVGLHQSNQNRTRKVR